MALQSQCGSSAAGLCADAPTPVLADSSGPDLPSDVPTTMPKPAIAAATAGPPELPMPSRREVALREAGSLIAGTFDALVEADGSGETLPAEVEKAAVAAGEKPDPPADGGAAEASPALAKRSVTSVPVGSDGQPIWSARSAVASAASTAAAEAVRGPGQGGAAGATAAGDLEPLAFAASTGAAPRPQTRPVTATPSEPVPETVGPGVAENGTRVGGSPVNVRANPDGDAARLFVLAAGAEVRATHAERGWVRIVAEGDRAGWVYGSYLVGVDSNTLPGAEALVAEAEPGPAVPQAAASEDVRTVRGQGVNVRANPSGERLFALAGGTEVRVTGSERGWLRITDPEGRSGWVYSRYLSGG